MSDAHGVNDPRAGDASAAGNEGSGNTSTAGNTRALPLRALAPAKINLGLFLGPVRPDGRHELVSVMQSISLADELTLSELTRSDSHPSETAGDPTQGAGGGNPAGEGPPVDEVICAGVEGENLAGRALAGFREATGWGDPPRRLEIVKRVPVAAGLGGGSGDAAAALRLAARASGFADETVLARLARALGADVPAQVVPGRWLASGAGERLSPLPDPGSPFGVLVLPLARALSTAEVYGEADRLGIGRGMGELEEHRGALAGALAGGAQMPPFDLLHNDLERPAIARCPEIEGALEEARGAGAQLAMVSGSGPTVIGLFTGADGPERAQRAAESLAGRTPGAVAAVPVGARFARPLGSHEDDR